MCNHGKIPGLKGNAISSLKGSKNKKQEVKLGIDFSPEKRKLAHRKIAQPKYSLLAQKTQFSFPFLGFHLTNLHTHPGVRTHHPEIKDRTPFRLSQLELQRPQTFVS